MSKVKDKIILEHLANQRNGYRNLCLEYKDRIDNISQILRNEMYNEISIELSPIIDALQETIKTAEEQGIEVCLSNLKIIAEAIECAVENGKMKHENPNSDGLSTS